MDLSIGLDDDIVEYIEESGLKDQLEYSLQQVEFNWWRHCWIYWGGWTQRIGCLIFTTGKVQRITTFLIYWGVWTQGTAWVLIQVELKMIVEDDILIGDHTGSIVQICMFFWPCFSMTTSNVNYHLLWHLLFRVVLKVTLYFFQSPHLVVPSH